jgi:GNAT superfamily N-acetyltransferase
MGLRVEVLEHGSDATWIALGPLVMSRQVVKDLAGPVYSSPATTWLVARDGAAVVGFASLRQVGGAWAFDYGYVVPERRGKGVFAKLAKERDKLVRKAPAPCRALIPERRWPHYEERGWTELSRRGSWLNIERAP